MNFFTKTSSSTKNNNVVIGFTIDDIDFILKVLDKEKTHAAEELHQFAIQSNQLGQRNAMEHFKKVSNIFEYLKDRLEYHLNSKQGGEYDNIG